MYCKYNIILFLCFYFLWTSIQRIKLYQSGKNNPDLLDGLGADSPGDVIALLLVDDSLPHQLHGAAHGLESGHADLSGLNNILDGTVVLGVLVLGLVVGGLVVVGSGLVVGGGRGVGRGVSVSRGGGVLVGGDGNGQGDQGEKCEGL